MIVGTADRLEQRVRPERLVQVHGVEDYYHADGRRRRMGDGEQLRVAPAAERGLTLRSLPGLDAKGVDDDDPTQILAVLKVLGQKPVTPG